MKLDIQALWNDKKKRTILIVVIAACLLVAIIIPIAVGQISNRNKDFYERFKWGTNREKVFRQLDKLGIDYDYDDGDNELNFYVENVQGSEANGRAYLRFSESGILKSVRVEIRLASNSGVGQNDHGTATATECMNLIINSLNKKYTLLEDESTYRTGIWQDGTWEIRLGKTYNDTSSTPISAGTNLRLVMTVCKVDLEYSKRQ